MARLSPGVNCFARYKWLIWPADGTAASVGSVLTDGSLLNEIIKAGSQAGAEKLFTDVLGHTPSTAARAVALIELSGGWDAFVERVRIDILGLPVQETRN